MPVMSVSIEIDGRSWTAAAPQEICRGECDGPIAYVPNRTGYDTCLNEHLGWAASHNEKRIYVCDSTGMALRPLIPHALGFVFGEGTTLGHFAGVLRHHRIPACIDQYLWQWARDTVLATGDGRPCRLRCGRAVVLPEEVRSRYHAQLEDYQRRLGSHRVAVPVYDVARRTRWAADAAIDARIGEKALAVNALQVEGLPAASALILTNLDGDDTRLAEDFSFLSLVEQIFPLFGHTPGYALMVRGSLYSGDGSHSAWSGLIKSSSVTSPDDLARAVATQVSRWKGVRDFDNRLGFSIIVQERIAHPVRGILGTGRPWDYSPEGIVAELMFDHGEGAGQNQVFLGDVEANLRNGAVRETARLFSKQNATLDGKRFCEVFTQLVRDGLVLRDLYSVPLDIEFVVTGNLRYVFVQFRPLFRL